MLFSVIVPTCQRDDLLARCLERLAPEVQRGFAGTHETIVSDDGSAPTAQALIAARFTWARWLEGPRRGPAANRNHGSRNATGEWLVFVDDDCIPDPDYLAALAHALAAYPETNVFEGRTYVDRPRRSLAESAPVNESGGCLWSCNFAIRRSLFEAMNGFDERFQYPAMEDVEFRLRLKQRSEYFRFVREAAVCHPWRAVNAGRDHARYEQSLLLYLRIHPEEAEHFTSAQCLLGNARTFLRSTLPALWQLCGTGAGSVLREHLYQCGLAWRLWKNRSAGENNPS